MATNAERQAAFRVRRAAEIKQLRQAPPDAQVTKLQAEIERLRAEITSLKAKASPSGKPGAPARTGKPDDDTKGDPRIIRQLQSELGRERELRLKAEAKAAAIPAAERDREVERLKTRARNLELQVRHLTKWTADVTKRYALPRVTYNAIIKCLHPDERAKRTPKQIDEACGMLTEWWKAATSKGGR